MKFQRLLKISVLYVQARRALARQANLFITKDLFFIGVSG
jgi:hypothetical protein